MNIPKLVELSTKFYKAIEAIPIERRPVGMQSFPMGACGDASLLLGAYFKDHELTGFKYVCGERGSRNDDTWTTHAWLQCGTCVVDITAGQFPDAPSSILVADPSAWHAVFETDLPQESDFRLWSGHGAEILSPMYKKILAHLASDCNS